MYVKDGRRFLIFTTDFVTINTLVCMPTSADLNAK